MSKVVVNKETLFEFLIVDAEDITKEHIDEVYKVIGIVLQKYQSKYYRLFEELESRIMQCILERRSRFEPKYDAYNYVFTISRNEAGNYINKYSREYPVEEFFGPCTEDCGCFKAEGILGKYQSILTGSDNSTNVLRISREDTINLMIEYANFNPALKKIKKEFTQKEAKQLYVMVKSLLSQ